MIKILKASSELNQIEMGSIKVKQQFDSSKSFS